ncbi:MAG: hypothetical protein P8105_04240, partial [Dehalococcoidia bacterium]
HPQEMWRIIQQQGARPTHQGAEKMFTTFAPEMKNYSDRVAEILDDVWDNDDYHEWAADWMKRIVRINPERVEARRKEYEESRRKP